MKNAPAYVAGIEDGGLDSTAGRDAVDLSSPEALAAYERGVEAGKKQAIRIAKSKEA